MKKFFLYGVFLALAALAATPSAAQHYVGVKGGYASGSVRLFPPTQTLSLWNLYTGGVSWKYYSTQKYVGGVGADLEYIQQGYRQENFKGSDTLYVRQVNSIMLPMIWQPHFYFFERRIRVFVNLGVTFSYVLNSSYQWRSRTDGIFEQGDYEMELVRDNRFGYGLVGGAGIGYLAGRMEYFGEFRYYVGYSDVLKNRNKYASNPLRSPLDDMTFCVGVYYRLGKGGILSAPSKNAAAKMERSENRRLEKALELQKAREGEAEAQKALEESQQELQKAEEGKAEAKEELKEAKDQPGEPDATPVEPATEPGPAPETQTAPESDPVE